MRIAILLLVLLIVTLLGNIVAYSVSEDYRFFVKKIKYSGEVVYESPSEVDDTQNTIILDDTFTDGIVVLDEGITFLEALWVKQEDEEPEEIEQLTAIEQEVLDQLREKFVLVENVSTASLFDITTEYPDPYREYSNKHLSLYIFSTKTYDQVYNIFDVLSYELPYTLNETNNFWEKSFYINLLWAYSDEKVRIVFQYQNKAFWLKIKKDNYNTVKQILEQFNVE